MEQKLFIQFKEPSAPKNAWQGQLTLDSVSGHLMDIVCSPSDPKTNLSDPIPLAHTEIILAKLDRGRTAILYGLERMESELNFDNGAMSLSLRLKAEIAFISPTDLSQGLETKASSFNFASPIVFSFISQKAYKISVTKTKKRFSISDSDHLLHKFSSKIFSQIIFSINKNMTDSVDGNVAKISYSSNIWFKPRKKFTLRQILAITQIWEKLLFAMVGGHCGAPIISVKGKNRREEICKIVPSSLFYEKIKVVPGMERIWTLSKVKFDLGSFIDQAMASAKLIEKPVELLLDAQISDNIQDRFFKRVRCLEAISRDLLPKGSENVPKEINEIAEVLKANDAELASFFEKRCRPIFAKRNGIGYAVDFMKLVFPFNPVLEIDKRVLSRLRNLEAHAASHNFSSEELYAINLYSETLDFVLRGLLLKFLGFRHDQILSGIPTSRFGWIIGRTPPT